MQLGILRYDLSIDIVILVIIDILHDAELRHSAVEDIDAHRLFRHRS